MLHKQHTDNNKAKQRKAFFLYIFLMCGCFNMSYYCLAVCLSVWKCMLFFLHISTQLNTVAFIIVIIINIISAFMCAKKCECRKVCYTKCVCAHMCWECVCGWMGGCKLKGSRHVSPRHIKTTRTSALMLHLPCLFTASCPFVGHSENTHTHTYCGIHVWKWVLL